jgi:osmotically-inducible protein OsmY
MIKRLLPCQFLLVLCLLAPASSQSAHSAQQKKTFSPRAQERIIREVRHNLLMLPNYGGAFDHIAFRLNGYDVILLGQVVHATLEDDAARAIKHIEGVERVENRIEILPPSPGDDRLRQALFRAIYGYPSLQHYGVGSNRPIQIVVRNGHVTLEGVVSNQADKNVAGIQANSVPGAFSVTNNLMLERKGKSK